MFFLFSRYGCFEQLVKGIEEHEGGLDNFTKGYDFFGINPTPDGGVICREWAPRAKALYLRGDFSKVHESVKQNHFLFGVFFGKSF